LHSPSADRKSFIGARNWELIMLRCRSNSVAAVLLLTASGVLATGCDEKPAVPPDLATPPSASAPTEIAAPTTQELMSGPRKSIGLGTVPLKASVPQSWSIKSLNGGSIHLLGGPAPLGVIQIQIAQRPVVPAEKLKSLVAIAKKELVTDAATVKVVDVHPMKADPTAQVVERQAIGQTMPAMPVGENGTEMSKPETLYSWTLTYYVPEGPSFNVYELNFVGLTIDEFKANESLLREVLDSIQPVGGPTTSPAAQPATTPAGA
jgi:hypothetical protein